MLSCPKSEVPEIKTADQAFAPVLAALHKRCFERPWSVEDFTSLLADPACCAYLLISGDKPLGFIVVRAAADEAEIITIGVAPGHRHHGHARRLLNHAAEFLASTGCARLFLEVAVNNAAAKALYEGFGFETVGRRANYIETATGRLDADIMCRHLAALQGPTAE